LLAARSLPSGKPVAGWKETDVDLWRDAPVKTGGRPPAMMVPLHVAGKARKSPVENEGEEGEKGYSHEGTTQVYLHP